MAELTPAGLRIAGVNLSFGGNKVLQSVSFDVQPGSITALIGPNGAGKSSLLNVVTTVYTPDSGAVELTVDGQVHDLLALGPHQLASLGVARTFQNLQLVPGISVLDNVMIGRHRHMKANQASLLLRTPKSRREEAEHRQVCRETLDFLGVGDVADWLPSGLPYGVLKRIELARALVAKPQLLLLDEPAAGLNDQETAEMSDVMRLIRETNTCTQVVVEHDMNLVMSVSDEIVVLNFGTVLTSGTVDEVRSHPDVIAAYLGSSEAS